MKTLHYKFHYTQQIDTRKQHVIASKCKSKLKPKRDDMHKQNSLRTKRYRCLRVLLLLLSLPVVVAIVVVGCRRGGFDTVLYVFRLLTTNTMKGAITDRFDVSE